jgi:hypothetical protein
MGLKPLGRSKDSYYINMGNLSHKEKSRDTDWPIGCSESESKSGLTSRYPMRQGEPVASLKVVDIKQRGGTYISWPLWQSNSLPRFCLPFGRKTVHTACQQNSP